MHPIVNECLHLTEDGIEFLRIIEQQMGIVADLSRADILLYAQKSANEFVVVGHAQPHSLAHVYNRSREGRVVSAEHRPEVPMVFNLGKAQKAHRSFISEGAPVVRQPFPIFYPSPCTSTQQNGNAGQTSKVVAVLVIVTNLIEFERHRLRSQVYREALEKLQAMLLCGKILGAEKLSSFGEQDGIIFTDKEGIIRYASGVAGNLYRRIGYKETMVGRHLSDLDTDDETLRHAALFQNSCIEWETEETGQYWIRKAIPLVTYPPARRFWFSFLSQTEPKNYGMLILMHDDTQLRQQDQEIRIKNAMIQEVHHRVKNNLQTIAGLLRMQIRRVDSSEARAALEEALKRILSVAVIHEFLSNDSSNIINIKELCSRIINQFQQGMLDPEQTIRLELTGDSIYLPSRQATACSLIINELLQNALEHGFEQKREGVVHINLEDDGEEVIIKVVDNGDGIPEGFQLDQAESLGLQIVKILVQDDLKGKIQLDKGIDNGEGTSVKIIFSKSIFKGEAGWKEHVLL